MEIFFPIESLKFSFSIFYFEFGMHARPIRPHNLKELPKYFLVLRFDSVAYVLRLSLFN